MMSSMFKIAVTVLTLATPATAGRDDIIVTLGRVTAYPTLCKVQLTDPEMTTFGLKAVALGVRTDDPSVKAEVTSAGAATIREFNSLSADRQSGWCKTMRGLIDNFVK
jgi:hypothetical protein